MALRRNILLFHQGALGDFVLTWPIALALARIHPQSRVFYVTHAQKGKLAEKVLGVESVRSDGVTLRLVVKSTPGRQWALQRALREAIKQELDAHGIVHTVPPKT